MIFPIILFSNQFRMFISFYSVLFRIILLHFHSIISHQNLHRQFFFNSFTNCFSLLNHFSNSSFEVFLSPNLIVYFKFCIYFSFNSFTKLFLVDIFFVQLFDKNFLICIFPLKFPNVLLSQILFYTSHSAFISLYYISYTFSRRYFFPSNSLTKNFPQLLFFQSSFLSLRPTQQTSITLLIPKFIRSL